ncbi:MAG: helix-turn-helix domain-containing protein [Clostridiales bacterium]|nr:helix-turn-helix domain-containing protein [Clostridiales bacterium]
MKYNRYPKHDAIRDYFPLPNEIFCPGLSSGEITVYAYLLYWENRKTFQRHPSFRTIGNALNMSRNTVSKYVKQLEDKQLIRTEPTDIRTASGVKRNGNLLYTVLPIEQAKSLYFERQLQRAACQQAHEKAIRKLEQYDRQKKREAV